MTRQNSAYLTYILMIPAREFIKITIRFLQGFEKDRFLSAVCRYCHNLKIKSVITV